LQAQLKANQRVVVDDRVAQEWKAKYEAQRVVADRVFEVLKRSIALAEKVGNECRSLVDKAQISLLAGEMQLAAKTPLVEMLSRKTERPTIQSVPKPGMLVQHDGTVPLGQKSYVLSRRNRRNPEQRILDAVAWFESIGITAPEQTAVAFLAGYRYGGGAFNNPRGALRTKALVEYVGSDRISLTEEGRELANQPVRPLTTKDLHSHVIARLPGPERRILTALLECYPNAMSNHDLAAASGYSIGGAFNNPKGRLRSLGLVEYVSGGVRARDLLFLPE